MLQLVFSGCVFLGRDIDLQWLMTKAELSGIHKLRLISYLRIFDDQRNRKGAAACNFPSASIDPVANRMVYSSYQLWCKRLVSILHP